MWWLWQMERTVPVLILAGRKRRLIKSCIQGQQPRNIKEERLWKCRQIKPNRLLNGGNLYVSLLHTEFGERSDAHYVDKSAHTKRIISQTCSTKLPVIGLVQRQQRLANNSP